MADNTTPQTDFGQRTGNCRSRAGSTDTRHWTAPMLLQRNRKKALPNL